MHILDGEKETPLYQVQFYLTPADAIELREKFASLLNDAEANEHEHIISGGREISFSLITPTKLKNISGYSAAERKMFSEK